MKRLITACLATAALFAATSALATPPVPLPQSESLRAIACSATLTAMSSAVRPTSASMADELTAIAAKWRTKAVSIFAVAGQGADAVDSQIGEQVAALTGSTGLPAGTFDKAQTCQNEGASLPAS